MELNQTQVDALYHCIRRVRNSGYEGPPGSGLDKSSLVMLQALLRPAFLGGVSVVLQSKTPATTVIGDELFE